MPKIVNHDEYRQEMLEKCFYFFGRKGYSNVTMEEIGAELGVSKGILYHYFPSKEGVLSELIKWAGAKNINDFVRQVDALENVEERFDAFMVVLRESGKFYQNIMLLAVDKYRTSDIEQVTALYNLFTEGFVSLISETLNISQQFARSIFICVVGIIFNSLAVNDVKEYKSQLDFFEAVFRPLVVDVPGDIDKAVQKFKDMYMKFLINLKVVQDDSSQEKQKNTGQVNQTTRIKKNRAKK